MQLQERHDLSSTQQDARPNGVQIPPSPQNASLELVFPPEHNLCRLRTLWDPSSAAQPLHMNLASDPVSAAHLRILLNQAAQMRLQSAFPNGPHQPMADLEEGALVYLPDDQMSAWLVLFPPTGKGERLSFPKLCHILATHNIVSGINWPLLRHISNEPDRYFRPLPIAMGTAPVGGEDGRVVDRYSRCPAQAPLVDELGQSDYIKLKLVQDIQQDDVICEILPHTKGTQGSTASGRHFPAPAGQPAAIPQGRNTYLSEDGRYLLAERTGHLRFSGRNFQVNPVLELYDEDLHGKQNIKYLGDIHVHGDLCCGTSVYAIGSVQIDGVVEDCTIEAGEHIIVSSGVQGQNHAVLRAQKSVFAKYLEHCTVYARQDVNADCIINCQIFSNDTVRARTGRGSVIGGTVHAARQVDAAAVGSMAECPTHIMLGGQPCEEAERTRITNDLAGVENQIKKLEQQPKTPQREQALSKLHLTHCVAQMKLEKFSKELAAQQAHSLSDSPHLLCSIAYPGTTVSVGRDSFRITQIRRECSIGLANGVVGPVEVR